MTKWKDTARAKTKIIKQNTVGEDLIIEEGTLLLIEKELPREQYLVSNTNPSRRNRKHFTLKMEEVVFEDYSITRDINIVMLLADGWDAQDLLRNRDSKE